MKEPTLILRGERYYLCPACTRCVPYTEGSSESLACDWCWASTPADPTRPTWAELLRQGARRLLQPPPPTS